VISDEVIDAVTSALWVDIGEVSYIHIVYTKEEIVTPPADAYSSIV